MWCLCSLAEVHRIMSTSGSSRRCAGDVAGSSGTRVSNEDVGVPWAKETSVVYWDMKVPVNPPMKVRLITINTFFYVFTLSFIRFLLLLQSVVRSCDHIVKNEDRKELKLHKRVEELEAIIRNLNLEMKEIKRDHVRQIRARDKKEVIFFVVVGGCATLYCVSALLVRGFV